MVWGRHSGDRGCGCRQRENPRRERREGRPGSRKEATLAGHVKEKGKLYPDQIREFYLKVQGGRPSRGSEALFMFKGVPRETPVEHTGLRNTCFKG